MLAAVLDRVISSIEAALELERELGVRAVECDRGLLAPLETFPAARRAETVRVSVPTSAASVCAIAPEPSSAPRRDYDFVFLHERRLSAGGAEMMAKITAAMKKTPETAPIVVDTPLPPARAYVVLGSFALKKFFPALRGSPGQWLKSEEGTDILVSNSPEYILRFGPESAAVKKIKQDMWRSLKTVEQRLAAR